MLRELAQTTFESQGYHLTVCTNPHEVVAMVMVKAYPHRFNAIVTDCNMPSKSGIEVGQDVSAINPDIPIVLVSAYLSPAGHTAALASGIKEIVDKPTMLQKLGGALARLLNGQNHDVETV